MGVFMVRFFSFVFVLFSGGCAFGQEINSYYASENLTLTVCNQDGDSDLMIIIVDKHPFSTSIDGRYRVSPSTCTDFYRDSGEGTEHSIYFIDPATEAFLDFDFGAGWRGGSFCVNPAAKNDLFDSVLVSPGRTTTCSGAEVLKRAPIGFSGGSGKRQEITTPAFSSTTSATDGQTCFLGFCM